MMMLAKNSNIGYWQIAGYEEIKEIKEYNGKSIIGSI